MTGSFNTWDVDFSTILVHSIRWEARPCKPKGGTTRAWPTSAHCPWSTTASSARTRWSLCWAVVISLGVQRHS